MSKTPSTGIRTHARGFATTSSLTLVEFSSAGYDGRALSPHVMTFASRFNRQPSRSPGRGPAILRATPQLLWAAV